MTPQHDTAVEAKQQVLAHGFDALEDATVQHARNARHPASRVRALRENPLSDERLEQRRDAVQ